MGVHGPPGGDETDLSVAGDAGGSAGGGVDDLDHGHALPQGVALARVVEDRGGGRVAGDDEHLDPGVHQLVHNAQGQGADLANGPGAVGGVGGVADVEELLTGELVQDRASHREAADPRVEHSDGCVIHAATLCARRPPQEHAQQ